MVTAITSAKIDRFPCIGYRARYMIVTDVGDGLETTLVRFYARPSTGNLISSS